jgi:hypothetical protein
MSVSIVKFNNQLPPTSEETIEKIRIAEERIREHFQIEFCTEHVFHAGMYARTVRIAPNVVFTTVLVKRPTLLISHGKYEMLNGDQWVGMDGYNVLQGSAGRKQIYRTLTEVEWTMIFPTDANTVDEAEAEFTDETDSLLSRQRDNDIVITGVPACLE